MAGIMNIFTGDTTAMAVALTLLLLLVPQIALTSWFVWAVSRRSRQFASRDGARSESASIPAEVVLCLRGCDPTLEQVIETLGGQRHGNWRLRIVVDSEDDPAWPVARSAVARLAAEGRASWLASTVEPLAERPATGSLKCASLRQALSSLAPETQVVALVDADAVVHDGWLISMVDECMRPGVGAVSGNRWYDPVHDSVPGTVRAIWNAGAIVQMTAFGIPWGGSLAVRREAMEACGWTEIIKTSLCEDTALAAPLWRSGWTYRFIPALVAIDDDDTVSMRPLTRWIARQLLTARLHHPLWPAVAVHGLTTSLALAAAVAICAVAGVNGHGKTLAIVGGSLAVYEIASLALVFAIEKTVRNALQETGRTFRATGWRRGLSRCLILPATQWVYAKAVMTAILAQTIDWRGVVYEIGRGEDGPLVRMRHP